MKKPREAIATCITAFEKSDELSKAQAAGEPLTNFVRIEDKGMVLELKHVSGEEEKDLQCTP